MLVVVSTIKEHGGTSLVNIPTSMDTIVLVQAVGGPCAGILQLMENRMP